MITKNIYKAVMKSIKQHIAEVQKKFDEECDQIEREAQQKKFDAHMNAVNSIVGKLR